MEAIFKKIIHKDSNILLALSGGPDSMYLLHRLVEYRRKVPFLLEAAHLHHGLRKEADEDLAFVRAICKQWNVTLYEKQVQVADYAKEHKMGVEEAGRLLRYRFFRECKREGGVIALAHHLDDQVETMLLRLIRGTGIEGIGGMTVREGDLFRPLLHMRKADIINYLREHEIPYVLDHTNDEGIYTRNKVRLDIVPAAESINPNFSAVMESFRSMAVEDEDYLYSTALRFYEENKEVRDGQVLLTADVFEEHPSIWSRILRLAIEEVRGDLKNIRYDHIRSLEMLQSAETGKGVDLPGCRIANSYGTLVISKEREDTSFADEVFLENGRAEFNGHRFEIGGVGEESIGVKNPDGLCIRTRRPGDKIKLKVGSKKLKDLFIDEKIERSKRDRWPIVEEDGDIIWVVGLRKSARQEEKEWKRLTWIPSPKM